MIRFIIALLLSCVALSPAAVASELRGCRQTCAELLHHDQDCEKICNEKDAHPQIAGFCPEYTPCFQTCEAKGKPNSPEWSNCRDICAALFIRVECADKNPLSGPGHGLSSVGAGAGGGGSGGAAKGNSPQTNSKQESNRLETSPDRGFAAKGQLGVKKDRDALHSSNGIESAVEDAIAGSLAADKKPSGASTEEQSELTLFQRVHRKYESKAWGFR
jgi:hypothetical protein